MTTAVKILKTIAILALLAAVILVFWFGVFSATAKVDPPIPEPTALGSYPTEILQEKDFKINFSLEEFLKGTKMQWDEQVSFDGDFIKDPGNAGRELYDANSDANKIADAINLMRLGSFNETGIPYFGYYTDAGGAADIAGAIKGKLMSQTIHAQNGDDFFHQNINAIVQDPDFPMGAATVKTAETILNKAKRQLNLGTDVNILVGAFPKYVYGEDYKNEAGEVVLVDGNPTVFEDGRCTASWTAAVNKYQYEAKKPPSNLSEKSKFKLTYGNKFILSLHPTDYVVTKVNNKEVDYSKLKPVTWFNAAETTIEKIYVDADGKDATSKTDHYYIRVVATADLPKRPENGSSADIEKWAKECKQANLNSVLDMPNPDYVKDINNEYLNGLVGYTGANPVWFTALKYTFEIWDCGLLKSWRTDEGWYGTLVAFTGDVQPFNPTTYTYSKEYCNMENFYKYLGIKTEAKA